MKKNVVLYDEDIKPVLVNTLVFQSHFPNGQIKCESVVPKVTSSAWENCHYEWFEDGSIKKETQISQFSLTPIKQTAYDNSGKVKIITTFQEGLASLKTEYTDIGKVETLTEYIMGIPKLSTTYDLDKNIVLSKLYTSKGDLLEYKEFYPNGREKKFITYNIYQHPKLEKVKEFHWSKSGESIDTWYSIQQSQLEHQLANKQTETASDKAKRLARQSIYKINFNWSESQVDSLYTAAGGFCTSRKSTHRIGYTAIQLACKTGYKGKNTYYYFENGAMVTIQE